MSGDKAQAALLQALLNEGRLDAYRAARRCSGVSAMEAGRALLALVSKGLAVQVEDGGSNALAAVFAPNNG